MQFQEIRELDSRYILHSYGRVNVALREGKGARAYDHEGKSYIDFTSGIGVNSLGYCPENWCAAVQRQASRLQHMSNYYFSEPTALLAKKLAEVSGMSRAFFCNSGAEANECAVKVARKSAAPGKYEIITLENSFHGRTLTTLAATGQEAFHREFLPLTEGFTSVPAGDIAALERAVGEKTCAVMLECIQGEGGVVPLEEEYLRQVRALCDEKGILLLIDEVQTGIGRTGSFFSYQSAGILPDVVTAAKGLGGGLPIGVCLVGEKQKDVFAPGDNGSTFGGNPVVCAGALEIVSTVSAPEFLRSVEEKGRYFREKLLQMPGVESVRGRGLMLGIGVKGKTAKEVMLRSAETGLLVLTAKERVRFLPPLNITREEIDEGLSIFAAAVAP